MSSASKKKRRKRRPRSPAAPANQQPSAAQPPAVAPTPARPRRRKGMLEAAEERPPAPWGSFPLVELVVFVGLVMLVVGLIVGVSEPRGQTLLVTGIALASLAGLELSVREHFSGFRSHTLLLASVAGVATLLALYYLADLDSSSSMAGGAAVAVLAGLLLLRLFRARSGGRSVKLR